MKKYGVRRGGAADKDEKKKKKKKPASIRHSQHYETVEMAFFQLNRTELNLFQC